VNFKNARCNNKNKNNIVAPSDNHSCNGNATMLSVCIIKINLSVHSVTTLSMATRMFSRQIYMDGSNEA
jgi:hypothetical protein